MNPADEADLRAWCGVLTLLEGMRACADRQLRSTCGLSGADLQILVHLEKAPGGVLRVLELSTLLSWGKSRLSQHLSRMETRGLVSRQPCGTDQRGTFVSVTPHGGALLRSAIPQHQSAIREILAEHLTTSELATLSVIWDKVRHRVAEKHLEE